MIHVINQHNRHLYLDVLEEMFRVRHEIFVEQRGWKKLHKQDGLEVDQFDTKDTTYFLKISRDGRILGGMRMYPTTVDTQLNTIFKETCNMKLPPCGPTHYEWSRYFIADTKFRSELKLPVHMELYAAILEYAVAVGIESLSGFIDIPTFNRGMNMPWDMRQLGVHYEYGGTEGEPKGYGVPIQLMIDRTMMRKTWIGWRMRKPIISLSIGADAPLVDTAFKASVVLKMAKFIEQNPHDIDIVCAFVKALRSVNPDVRDITEEFVQSVIGEDSWQGFDPRLIKENQHTQTSMTLN